MSVFWPVHVVIIFIRILRGISQNKNHPPFNFFFATHDDGYAYKYECLSTSDNLFTHNSEVLLPLCPKIYLCFLKN